MNRSQASEYSSYLDLSEISANITIKQENTFDVSSFHIQSEIGDADNLSVTSEAPSQVSNILSLERRPMFMLRNPTTIQEPLKKPEEKPIVHRNNGTISKEKYRFHKYLNKMKSKLHGSTQTERHTVVTTLEIQPVYQPTESDNIIETANKLIQPENVLEILHDEYGDVDDAQMQHNNQQPGNVNLDHRFLLQAVQNVMLYDQNRQNIKSKAKVICEACERSYVDYKRHLQTKKHQDNITKNSNNI